MVVDDRFLLVSSANATNRSMSFDSELGIAWEAPDENPSIRAVRIELLARARRPRRRRVRRAPRAAAGLVDRLDALARAGTHRLRIHRRNQDERPGPILSRFVPDDPPFDPDHIEDMLPEPGVWLDRDAPRSDRDARARRQAARPPPPAPSARRLSGRRQFDEGLEDQDGEAREGVPVGLPGEAVPLVERASHVAQLLGDAGERVRKLDDRLLERGPPPKYDGGDEGGNERPLHGGPFPLRAQQSSIALQSAVFAMMQRP